MHSVERPGRMWAPEWVYKLLIGNDAIVIAFIWVIYQITIIIRLYQLEVDQPVEIAPLYQSIEWRRLVTQRIRFSKSETAPFLLTGMLSTLITFLPFLSVRLDIEYLYCPFVSSNYVIRIWKRFVLLEFIDNNGVLWKKTSRCAPLVLKGKYMDWNIYVDKNSYELLKTAKTLYFITVLYFPALRRLHEVC